MKKVFIILCVLIFSIFLVSCKKEIKFDMEELSEEMILKMKEDYIKEVAETADSVDDLWIRYYYGKYGDSYAFVISESGLAYADAEWGEKVAGITIIYPSMGPYIHMYNNGKFYRLQEAYDKGLMNEESLTKLIEVKNNTTKFYDKKYNEIIKK